MTPRLSFMQHFKTSSALDLSYNSVTHLHICVFWVT